MASLNAADRILIVVNHVIEAAIDLLRREPGEEIRTGGFFVMGVDGEAILAAVIGRLHIEDLRKCRSLANEKIIRLYRNDKHICSWESRRPESSQWGGAVRIRSVIYSFSGLPELWDQAAMLCVAIELRELEMREAEEISKRCGSESHQIFVALYEKLLSDAGAA